MWLKFSNLSTFIKPLEKRVIPDLGFQKVGKFYNIIDLAKNDRRHKSPDAAPTGAPLRWAI